jgi:hypothetical protein
VLCAFDLLSHDQLLQQAINCNDGDHAAKVSCCENITAPQKLPF